MDTYRNRDKTRGRTSSFLLTAGRAAPAPAERVTICARLSATALFGRTAAAHGEARWPKAKLRGRGGGDHATETGGLLGGARPGPLRPPHVE